MLEIRYSEKKKMIIKKYNRVLFITNIFKYIPWQATAAMGYILVFSLLPAFQTLATAAFVDSADLVFKGEQAYESVFLPLFCIAASLVYQNMMPMVNNLISVSAQNQLRIVLKTQVVCKQTRLKYQYLENEDTCDLIGRVCQEIDRKFWEAYVNLLNGVRLGINIVSMIVIVMAHSWLGGVLIISVSIPLLYLAELMGGSNYQMEKDVESLKRRYHYFGQILTEREYAYERKLFGYSSLIKDKYKKLFNQSYQVETKILRKSYTHMKSGSIITILIGMVIMAILLPSLERGNMSAGIYIGLVGAVFGLVQSMSWQMSSVVLGLARLKEYLKDYQAFMDMEEEDEACTEPWIDENFLFQSMEFRNVTFRYPGMGDDVLNNCSFQLNSEKTYAFVGANGAGKTTITKLIMGLYDTYEGEILINGRDIRTYGYAERKGMIAVAFQDFARYALPVDQNIHLGNMGEYDEGQVQKALDKVGLWDAVENMKEGIHTNLGKHEEESTDLSGGQWQRLEVARLLYARRAINILDEPTASLDPMAETRIYELFRSVSLGRFVIYITHRLGAARIADEILVLKDGRIAEKGSHDQLAALENGIYHAMYESQRKWYE